MLPAMLLDAPIAIFVFNRPRHLARTLRSLSVSPGFLESPIYVYADGPRSASDEELTRAARSVAQEFLGSRAVYRYRTRNVGLAASISEGVSELTDRFGQVIVVEDDLEVAPGFLTYMNQALKRYADSPDVYQVAAHMYATLREEERKSAVFLPIVSTWGWGTWKRAWATYDDKASGWERLAADRKLRWRFNFNGVYDYSAMLERQMRGKADSWGVRWYWSVFRQNGLVCYPPRTLVRNLGMDGSGTHGKGRLRAFSATTELQSSGDILLPIPPALEADEVRRVRHAIWVQNGRWLGYAVDRLRRLYWAMRRTGFTNRASRLE